MDTQIMNNKTRYKLTLTVLLFLMTTAITSIINDMDGVATVAVTGVMTTLSTYIWGETKRPSNKQ